MNSGDTGSNRAWKSFRCTTERVQLPELWGPEVCPETAASQQVQQQATSSSKYSRAAACARAAMAGSALAAWHSTEGRPEQTNQVLAGEEAEGPVPHRGMAS